MHQIGRFFAATIAHVAILSGLAQAASLEDVRARIHEEGSGVWMRQQFRKDIEPIGLTPGGVGTLVVLYSKKANVSIPFCTSYDVIMGVKKGKVTKGWKCGPDFWCPQ